MESFARISTLLETARDLTIEAAQSASTGVRRKDVVLATPGSFRETKKLLNSRMEREVLEGLRRVTAMMARGHDCSTFFADVVINVASPTIEIKKLVYLYLLRYAESEPDLALLSINTIQKALNDQNQLVRALAIRVMSGIRVPVISQIVALGIKKCASDMSAYVRKSAALAIPKCYRLDPGTLPLLKEYLGNLLGDKSYYVVGAAVMAFLEVCPEDLELVHPHYQSLVRMLIDMDEWGQLALLKLLTVYARRCFPVKTTAVKKIKEKEKKDSEAFYSDEEGDEKEDMEMVRVMDPDLQMFLTACLPLLQSRNSAVILAVARAYRHLAPSEELSKISGHLVSLLRATVDIKHIALINIVSIALEHPQIFSPYVSNFLIHRLDPPHIYRLKLEVLTLLFPHSDKHIKNLILNELEFYAQDYDKDLVRACVRAIGRCAQNERQNSTRCLRLLLRQIESPDGTLVAESLTVIRHIIQMNPSGHVPTVIKLAKALNTASNPIARASIIWLVGEFAGVNGGDNIAADTLRILAKGFHDEAEATKHQIVLLAAKVYAHYLDRIGASRQHSSEDDDDEEEDTHPIPLLFKYITLLARYDVSYDLRDRTRMYKSLLSVPSSTQLATLLLLAPKPVPHAPSPCEGIQKFTVGSAAMVLRAEGELDAAGLRGYEPLPEWVAEGQEPDRGVSGALGGRAKDIVEGSAAERIEKKVKEVEERAPKKSPPREETLDEWLEGSDDEEDDEEDEESEEETDDEEDDDEEEEETDEEESEEESDEDTSDEKTGMIAGRSK